MKLYGLPFSPFVQRVLIVARLKGHELALVSPPGGMVSPEYQAIAANRRIPVLETEDGWRLCESGAIARYLDEVLPGPALMPEDPRQRAHVRQIEDLVDKELGAGLRHFALQSMFRVYQDASRLDYGREQVALGLSALDRTGLGAGWAVGERPTLADATLIPVLSFATIFETHFDGGTIVDPESGVGRYRTRAFADPLGAEVLATMSGIVPIVMARRAAAAG